MSAYSGYPVYLTEAALALGIGLPAVADAGRQPAIHSLSSLIGQALEQGTPHADTLRRVRELRDGLLVAAAAAIQLVHLVDDAAPPALVVTSDSPADRKPIRRRDRAREDG